MIHSVQSALEPLPAPTVKKIHNKLVVVSNREPYSITLDKKTLRVEKTPGGLVSALDPVLRANQGLWICWEGTTGKVSYNDLKRLASLNVMSLPYEIRGVSLTEKEINHYYYGYANRQLWPAFHYFPTRCSFNHKDWQHYYSANQKFAQTILSATEPEDWVWVQDYHLMLVPGMVRQRDAARNVGFFSHIPFPNYEVFRILPRRKELLQGMLGSDLIGFHTPRYVENFKECVAELLPDEVEIHGDTLYVEDRAIRLGAFPISVDYKLIESTAQSPEVLTRTRRLRSAFAEPYIGLGVDRLDYTKGILERLDAISHLFDTYPEYKKRLVFIQIAVPSRTKVQEYQEMRSQIEQAVGRINGKHSEGGWTPIHYIYRGYPLEQLLPYFNIADFALVTPLRDGMNLVAKEYCVAKADLNGALILSELAGSAHQLKQALLVNPYHKDEVVESIHRALQMPTEEKHARMQALRESIESYDVHHWLKHYLEALELAFEQRHAPKPALRS